MKTRLRQPRPSSSSPSTIYASTATSFPSSPPFPLATVMADGTQPSAPTTANGHHPSISVTATTTTDPAILEQVVNHVFLPPKLPSAAPDDDTERSVNLLMLDETDAAARAFRMFLPHEQRKPWTRICRMLLWMKQAAKAPLEATKLSETLKSMLPGGVYSPCPFYAFLSLSLSLFYVSVD